MKSAGKRAELRFTAWMSAFVGTAIHRCKITIENHLLTAYDHDGSEDLFARGRD